MCIRDSTDAMAAARTGRPFAGRFFHGSGRDAAEAVYGEGIQEPILGKARYDSPSEADASVFGPKVDVVEVSLNNPLVISSDREWGFWTRQAGWFSSGPATPDDILSLRGAIEDAGYDGVVIRVPKTETEGKNLQALFGEDQVVSFRELEDLPRRPITGARTSVEAAEQAMDADRDAFDADNLEYLKSQFDIDEVGLGYLHEGLTPDDIAKLSKTDIVDLAKMKRNILNAKWNAEIARSKGDIESAARLEAGIPKRQRDLENAKWQLKRELNPDYKGPYYEMNNEGNVVLRSPDIPRSGQARGTKAEFDKRVQEYKDAGWPEGYEKKLYEEEEK